MILSDDNFIALCHDYPSQNWFIYLLATRDSSSCLTFLILTHRSSEEVLKMETLAILRTQPAANGGDIKRISEIFRTRRPKGKVRQCPCQASKRNARHADLRPQSQQSGRNPMDMFGLLMPTEERISLSRSNASPIGPNKLSPSNPTSASRPMHFIGWNSVELMVPAQYLYTPPGLSSYSYACLETHVNLKRSIFIFSYMRITNRLIICVL